MLIDYTVIHVRRCTFIRLIIIVFDTYLSHRFRHNWEKLMKIKSSSHSSVFSGYNFPQLREADAMFMVEKAPEWVDGEQCHRCRTPFSTFNRKVLIKHLSTWPYLVVIAGTRSQVFVEKAYLWWFICCCNHFFFPFPPSALTLSRSFFAIYYICSLSKSLSIPFVLSFVSSKTL